MGKERGEGIDLFNIANIINKLFQITQNKIFFFK